MSFVRSILVPAWSLLPLFLRWRALWIVSLMVFQALLDFINISIFIPLLGLIAKPDFVSSLKWFPVELANTSQPNLIMIFALSILSFSIVKYFIVWRITKSKASYAYQVAHHISLGILTDNLEMKYELFAASDYSKEMDRIANQPLAFANNIVISLATLISETLVGLSIAVGVAFFNLPLLASLLFILLPLGLIYFFNRKKIKWVSQNIKTRYPLSLKYALQAMEGWMEIKTGLKEKYFVDRFKKTSSELADTFATDHTLQILASRLTDLFATIIICVIVFWSVYFQTNYQQTLILLAVYVGASFRLLPSINRILNSLIQIKSHEHLLTNLKMKDSVKSIPSEDQAQSNFQNEISLESVSFSYPQRSILFEELSFRIKKGEKIAITGRSGGGKTSLLLLLLGILRPSKGKISIDDRLVTDLRNYQSLFSYVSQSPYVLDASIKENVAFGISSERIDREKVLRSLKQVDLQEFVEHLPLQEDTQLGERGILLSGGQRQRLALARALYADREVLILDEVTNQLDRETEEEVIQSLQKIVQMNRTLIMVTHHQQLLSIFDRIVKLENGKLVELSKEQRQ